MTKSVGCMDHRRRVAEMTGRDVYRADSPHILKLVPVESGRIKAILLLKGERKVLGVFSPLSIPALCQGIQRSP